MPNRQTFIDDLNELDRVNAERTASLTAKITALDAIWTAQSTAAREAEHALARAISERTVLAADYVRRRDTIEAQLRGHLPSIILRALSALPIAIQLIRDRGAQSPEGYAEISAVRREMLSFYERLKKAHVVDRCQLFDLCTEINRLAWEIPEVERALTIVDLENSEVPA